MILVILSHNITKLHGKFFVYYKHYYTLEYLDTIKIDSKVKNMVTIEVAKKYYLNNISKNMKDVK